MKVKLGTCQLIEEVMIGEDRLIHFSGVALGEACTIVLRGASTHILDEADRRAQLWAPWGGAAGEAVWRPAPRGCFAPVSLLASVVASEAIWRRNASGGRSHGWVEHCASLARLTPGLPTLSRGPSGPCTTRCAC